jgi:hypothetical protein
MVRYGGKKISCLLSAKDCGENKKREYSFLQPPPQSFCLEWPLSSGA